MESDIAATASSYHHTEQNPPGQRRPAMASAAGATPIDDRDHPQRGPKISLLTAVSIVVANMIGTGVFTSLGFQVADLPSPFAILVLWTMGGLVALCGALSYAELAAALPRSGGEYHLLSRIFHPSIGFLAGWVSATVGFAAPIALAAMAFGKYAEGIAAGLSPLWLSLLVVWITCAVHLTGIQRGSAFQNVFTILKVGLVVCFIAAGLFAAGWQPVSFAPTAGDWQLISGSTAFAVSLVYVMYAYSGWNASTYIVSEIRDPQRNVPRSLFFGTLLVLALYVALNATFLLSTPMEKFVRWDPEAGRSVGQVEIGLIAGRHIFGEIGGHVMAALICVGLVSSISSMTWIGPRVTMAMGQDFPALRIVATQSANGIPRVAMVLQLLIVTFLLFTSTFERVLIYIQLALMLCSFLTVLGVIVLRVRRPDLPRPYRTWGYPVTPVIFLAVSAWMMFYTVSSRPAESLAGLGTMLAGLVVYFLSAKTRRRETSPE